MEKIKNIILDLGGVLLNIDYIATIKAFQELGVKNIETMFTQEAQNKLFDGLDKGSMSPEEFRQGVREYSALDLTDEQIDDAWNAMLMDFPKCRIELLEGIRKNYRLFLLSNTNSIHYPQYIKYMRKMYRVDNLDEFFEKTYLSHEIGMRKPDAEAFNLIIDENHLLKQETLFVDDTLQHVEGARRVGLNAIWLDLRKMEIHDLFDEDFRLRWEN
jgi:HAD superfamily hydrolase (TIGR01549 family)